MAWNGLGTYVLNPAYSPEVNGTVIDATRYNGLTLDIATGITQALNKNGENSPTADINWGGFRLKNLAAPSANGDALSQNQVAKLADGAVGAPAVSFASETNTGFYRVSAGVIRYALAGADWLMIDSVGLLVGTNSRTGVGAGNGRFGVKGSIDFGDGGASSAQLNGNSTTFLELVNRGAGGIKFYTNSGGVVAGQVSAAGEWGLGTGVAPVAGYYLTTGAGKIVAPGVGLSAFKAVSTSRNTTTVLTNDPDLQVSLVPGTYAVQGELWWGAGASGGPNGLKFNFAFSGTTTSNGRSASSPNATLSNATPGVMIGGSDIFATNISTGALTEFSKISGFIVVTVTGILTLQWAQNSSGGQNLTLLAGSSLNCVKVG